MALEKFRPLLEKIKWTTWIKNKRKKLYSATAKRKSPSGINEKSERNSWRRSSKD